MNIFQGVLEIEELFDKHLGKEGIFCWLRVGQDVDTLYLPPNWKKSYVASHTFTRMQKMPRSEKHVLRLYPLEQIEKMTDPEEKEAFTNAFKEAKESYIRTVES